MITAERKPLKEIINSIKSFKAILLLGCNECVSVCSAGGRKEVEVLSSVLQMAFLKKGKNIRVYEHTLERQCDPEYVQEISSYMNSVDAVLSMACGCGVQEIARCYKKKPVFPALNTKFMGASEAPGVWAERCRGCGDCVIGYTGGICPITRCAKRIMNGPCGGSSKGKCEINPETDCAWHLIWNRLVELGISDSYEDIIPTKDWRAGNGGGPRRIIRGELIR